MERKPSTSNFYLQTEKIQFEGDYNGNYTQPVDYISNINEDLNVDGIISDINLEDYFSSGPAYSLFIKAGEIHVLVLSCKYTDVIRNDFITYMYTCTDNSHPSKP